MALKDDIKKLIGIEQGNLHRKRCLCLNDVARGSRLAASDIDLPEFGRTRDWRVYKKLLDFYGITVNIELADKTPAAG